MIYKLRDLLELISSEDIEIIGSIDQEIRGFRPILDAEESDLTFCSKHDAEAFNLINQTKSKVVICRKFDRFPNINKTLIFSKNPRLVFIKLLKNAGVIKEKRGIHSTVLIGNNCNLGENIYIGPYSVIEDGVIIGHDTKIGNNVHVYENVRIGANVLIDSGCVIGAEGFGFERDERGILEKFPHIGNVVIEDDVDIGANTCIDRGTLAETIIGEGTKIDNLVHIAHNVIIGKNCVIVCLSCIAGSVKIGDNSWIAPLAAIKNGLKIGSNALVGIGAVVLKDVPDNDVVAGVPAKSIKIR